MPAAASDIQDEVNLSPRPHLPPLDLDAADTLPPTDLDTEDKDEDVVEDAATALPVLLPDVDPPSQQSQQDGRQGTRHLRLQVEDILQRRPRHSIYSPPHTQTSRNGLRIGMHVIHVVSTSRTDIPVRHALNI